MKTVLTFIFFLTTLLTHAQHWDFEKPDYKKIEKNIQEKGSNLYYSTLMKRYHSSDSTMSLKEKRHLYYGYVFQSEYSPYGRSSYSDSLRIILQKAEHSEEDLENIIRFSDKVLNETAPFDLTAINHQLYALSEKKDTIGFNSKLVQMKIVIDALMSSGNGTSKKTAFYVISTSHEYALLNILGFQFTGPQALIEHYDYLTVAENDLGIEGLYFDVSPCLGSLQKLMGDD